MSRNRLDQETSPYLLQHRDNPVHWQPWDDDACRAIAAALRVTPGGPPAASKALTVAQATLRGLLLVDREPPDAMTRLSMVRNPG